MSSLSVRHPLQRAHTFLVRLLILCAVCVGLAACADGGSTSPDSASTNYSVALSVADKSLDLKVEVSPAAADHYREAHGRALDARAVEDLIGEGVRRAIANGSVELPDANAEQHIVLDLSEKLDSPRPLLHTEGGCLAYAGTVGYTYYWFIHDSLGCRYYQMTDWYDHFRNSCGGGDQEFYVNTTTLGPYEGC